MYCCIIFKMSCICRERFSKGSIKGTRFLNLDVVQHVVVVGLAFVSNF